MAENEKFSPPIITKANGKDRVVDFRDGLVPATSEDYAQIHGMGGAKHAPVSVVKCVICDFTKGTGDKSVTVSANISTETAEMLHAAATRFVTYPAALAQKPAAPAAAPAAPSDGFTLTRELAETFKESFKMLAAASKNGGTLAGDDLIALGKNMRAVLNGLKEVGAASAAPAAPAATPAGKDFDYSQERVNSYRQGKDGLAADVAPVNKLMISHQSFRDNGDLSRYPWVIKITNGTAQVKKDDNGATSYVGSTFKATADAWIMLSDADMFRMTTDITRFIRTWEECFGIPLVSEGVKARIEARQQYAAQKGE